MASEDEEDVELDALLPRASDLSKRKRLPRCACIFTSVVVVLLCLSGIFLLFGRLWLAPYIGNYLISASTVEVATIDLITVLRRHFAFVVLTCAQPTQDSVGMVATGTIHVSSLPFFSSLKVNLEATTVTFSFQV